MARTVKSRSELKEDKRKAFFVTASALALSLVFFISFFFLLFFCLFDGRNIPTVWCAALFVLCLTSFFAFIIKRKEYMILKSGVSGEKQAFEILKTLPSEFTVITNPVIQNRGKYNELDFVIIGKDAIFTVETKNYKGEISGSSKDNEIEQIKTGGQKKMIKNPVNQADLQGRRMRGLLYDMNLSYSVFPVLYFADESLKVNIAFDEKPQCKIIKSKNGLLDFIKSSHGKKEIKNKDKKAVIDVLKR